LALTPPLGGVFIWGIYGRTSINFILDSVGGHMGRITSFSKQVIVFFLVTALIIRPTFAANLGGWTLGGGVALGASTVYSGTKNVIINGADYIKTGTAKITPPVSAVSKVLARGAAGYALSIAVEQLLGAVDWVLDPANNRIRYYENPSETGQYKFSLDRGGNTFTGSSATTVCQSFVSWLKTQPDYKNAVYKGVKYLSTDSKKNVYYDCLVDYQNNGTVSQTGPAYGVFQPDYVQEEKYLPLDVVAQKVISNAESDTDKKAAAQVATTAAAADIVAEAENDNVKARPIVQQLEASAQTKPADEAAAEKAGEATGTTKPNAETGATDLALEFPIFCDWAPTVCEAAQTVISFPITLTEWWDISKSKSEEWAASISEAWSKVKEEYANKPTENPDTQLDLPDQSPPDINTDISFGGSCPASRSVPVSFAGISTEIEFSFQWFCEIASIAKPVIISISAFASALIVAGVRTEDD
jgi:hypothetical protein